MPDIRKNLSNKIKTHQSLTFSDQEVEWLLMHIGDEDADIRDGIVFSGLARGISENSFTLPQFAFIKNATIQKDLINFNNEEKLPATLTRSFSALLNGFIIQADGKKDSMYYRALSPEELNYFFTNSLNYLKLEHDYTGFSTEYGWVHGIAHGADFLLKASLHPDFPESKYNEILIVLQGIFLKLKTPFIDGEESRMATIIYELILAQRIEPNVVVSWLDEQVFPVEENIDFYRRTAFQHFLAVIFIQLERKNALPKMLKISLLAWLEDY